MELNDVVRRGFFIGAVLGLTALGGCSQTHNSVPVVKNPFVNAKPLFLDYNKNRNVVNGKGGISISGWHDFNGDGIPRREEVLGDISGVASLNEYDGVYVQADELLGSVDFKLFRGDEFVSERMGNNAECYFTKTDFLESGKYTVKANQGSVNLSRDVNVR